jgi:hypothetical protein
MLETNSIRNVRLIEDRVVGHCSSPAVIEIVGSRAIIAEEAVNREPVRSPSYQGRMLHQAQATRSLF